MNSTYSQEVADYLNNKFGDDYTMSEPFYGHSMPFCGNPIKLEQEPKEVVFRSWSKEMDDEIRWYYTENEGNEEGNLVAFVI